MKVRIFLKWLLSLVLAFAGMSSLVACSVTYQFAPIEAWVIDAETGKPIEGAVVTANWELVKGGLDGPRYYGQLEVKETITDANGRFFFEGFSREDSSGAELRESDPQVLIFKAGYKFERFTNDYPDGGAGLKKLRRTAAVSGKRVSLQKSPLVKEQVRSAHSDLVLYLGFLIKVMPHTNESENCYWQKIPQMLKETRVQEESMKRAGIGQSSIYAHLIANNDQYMSKAKVPCIAPKKLFGEESK